MKTFKTFLREGSYPAWLRMTALATAVRIRSLSLAIEQEKDVTKQNSMIAQQNKLLGYLETLSLAVGTSDNTLIQRIKKGF
jgi:hypothetical protein